jgi:hypothetical protein
LYNGVNNRSIVAACSGSSYNYVHVNNSSGNPVAGIDEVFEKTFGQSLVLSKRYSSAPTNPVSADGGRFWFDESGDVVKFTYYNGSGYTTKTLTWS